MEIIGIILLFGCFGVGIIMVYLFLQYINSVKAVKELGEKLVSKIEELSNKIEANLQKETEKK